MPIQLLLPSLLLPYLTPDGSLERKIPFPHVDSSELKYKKKISLSSDLTILVWKTLLETLKTNPFILIKKFLFYLLKSVNLPDLFCYPFDTTIHTSIHIHTYMLSMLIPTLTDLLTHIYIYIFVSEYVDLGREEFKVSPEDIIFLAYYAFFLF